MDIDPSYYDNKDDISMCGHLKLRLEESSKFLLNPRFLSAKDMTYSVIQNQRTIILALMHMQKKLYQHIKRSDKDV